MGAFTCCFSVPDEPNNTSSDNPCPEHRLCPKCFFQKLFGKLRDIFTKRQSLPISSPTPQPSSSDSEVVSSSSSDAMASQYDGRTNTAIFRYVQRRNEAPQRPEKGPSGSRVQPEPIGQHVIGVNPQSTRGNEIVVSKQKIKSQVQNSGASEKILPMGVEWGNIYTIPCVDDEDVCPTCLEEYSEENPKIILECSHLFHLGCILDWMERSQFCPVCRKVMVFDEAN